MTGVRNSLRHPESFEILHHGGDSWTALLCPLNNLLGIFAGQSPKLSDQKRLGHVWMPVDEIPRKTFYLQPDDLIAGTVPQHVEDIIWIVHRHARGRYWLSQEKDQHRIAVGIEG